LKLKISLFLSLFETKSNQLKIVAALFIFMFFSDCLFNQGMWGCVDHVFDHKTILPPSKQSSLFIFF